MPSFLFLNFTEFAHHCLEVAVKIKAEYKDQPIDYIVSIQRGGALMSKILSDILNVPIATLTVSTYEKLQQTKEPYIAQEISTTLSGKHVLVVDEICDSGATLLFVKDYLEKQAPASLRTAVLFVKSHSTFTPDFWAVASDKWIVFPGELRETAEALQKIEGLDSTVHQEFQEFMQTHGATSFLQEKLGLHIE
jgi:uncharacterized protein